MPNPPLKNDALTPQADMMRKLTELAERAANYNSAVLKRRVAVPSPQGGYRMEVQIIKAK